MLSASVAKVRRNVRARVLKLGEGVPKCSPISVLVSVSPKFSNSVLIRSPLLRCA
ncbi:hypothetical protein D3C86_2010230 [compost metagenome]